MKISCTCHKTITKTRILVKINFEHNNTNLYVLVLSRVNPSQHLPQELSVFLLIIRMSLVGNNASYKEEILYTNYTCSLLQLDNYIYIAAAYLAKSCKHCCYYSIDIHIVIHRLRWGAPMLYI